MGWTVLPDSLQEYFLRQFINLQVVHEVEMEALGFSHAEFLGFNRFIAITSCNYWDGFLFLTLLPSMKATAIIFPINSQENFRVNNFFSALKCHCNEAHRNTEADKVCWFTYTQQSCSNCLRLVVTVDCRFQVNRPTQQSNVSTPSLLLW